MDERRAVLFDAIQRSVELSSRGLSLAYPLSATSRHEWTAGAERREKDGVVCVSRSHSIYRLDKIEAWDEQIVSALSKLLWLPIEPKHPLVQLAEVGEDVSD